MRDVLCQIGVQARFSASHRHPVTRALHGHDYVVTTWFAGGDMEHLQVQVQRFLVEHFDHRTLPDELHSMEALRAEILMRLPLVEDIDIDRPVLGFKVRGRPA